MDSIAKVKKVKNSRGVRHARKFFDEFKEFAFKGNVLDMAVGILIGAAFNSVVQSMVNDLLSPVVKLAFNNVSNVSHVADSAVLLSNQKNYMAAFHTAFLPGKFVGSVFTFLIDAFCVFLIIKLFTKLRNLKKTEEEEEAPKISSTDRLLIEIRDLLKTRDGAENGPEAK